MADKERRQIPVMELKGVTKEYCLRESFFSKANTCVIAMNNINLEIQKGEIFGLVGQSGSGKTTTGRLMVKLENPSKGVIKLNGEPVSNIKGKALKNYRDSGYCGTCSCQRVLQQISPSTERRAKAESCNCKSYCT